MREVYWKYPGGSILMIADARLTTAAKALILRMSQTCPLWG